MVCLDYITTSSLGRLQELCLELCLDEESRSKIRAVSALPEDLHWTILSNFSTRVLSQRIHPIQRDDIHMASYRGYRAFMRRERSLVGKATNKSTIDVLTRINSFLTSRTASCSLDSLSDLIKYQLNFPPSRRFLKKISEQI